MPRSTQVKAGGSFRPIKKPYVKAGGVWHQASAIFAKASGVWHQVWPSITNFTTNLPKPGIPGPCISCQDGYIGPNVLTAIPTAVIADDNKLTHITGLTVYMAGAYYHRDEDRTVYDKFKVCVSGAYSIVSPNENKIKLGNVQYSSFLSQPSALDEDLRFVNFSIPTNHVLVGIEWHVDYHSVNNGNDNGSYTAFKVRYLTAPVLHADNTPATLTVDPSVNTVTLDAPWNLKNGVASSVTVGSQVPSGHTIRNIKFHFGGTGGTHVHTRIVTETHITSVQ